MDRLDKSIPPPSGGVVEKEMVCSHCNKKIPHGHKCDCRTNTPFPVDQKEKITPVCRENLKWDKGKLQFSLILPEFEEVMAEILTKGEKNHPKIDGNPSWQYVEPQAYIDALKRHVNKRMKGELDDQEMGTNHWAHVAVNAMFLHWFDNNEQRRLEDENK